MCEFVRELVAARERSRAEHERDLGLAWHIEALSRTAKDKRLLPLWKLLGKTPPVETPKEQRAAVEMLHNVYGGKLRQVKLKKLKRPA